jgi:hypothetical protein
VISRTCGARGLPAPCREPPGADGARCIEPDAEREEKSPTRAERDILTRWLVRPEPLQQRCFKWVNATAERRQENFAGCARAPRAGGGLGAGGPAATCTGQAIRE